VTQPRVDAGGACDVATEGVRRFGGVGSVRRARLGARTPPAACGGPGARLAHASVVPSKGGGRVARLGGVEAGPEPGVVRLGGADVLRARRGVQVQVPHVGHHVEALSQAAARSSRLLEEEGQEGGEGPARGACARVCRASFSAAQEPKASRRRTCLSPPATRSCSSPQALAASLAMRSASDGPGCGPGRRAATTVASPLAASGREQQSAT